MAVNENVLDRIATRRGALHAPATVPRTPAAGTRNDVPDAGKIGNSELFDSAVL
jgi:hypothetical protein